MCKRFSINAVLLFLVGLLRFGSVRFGSGPLSSLGRCHARFGSVVLGSCQPPTTRSSFHDTRCKPARIHLMWMHHSASSVVALVVAYKNVAFLMSAAASCTALYPYSSTGKAFPFGVGDCTSGMCPFIFRVSPAPAAVPHGGSVTALAHVYVEGGPGDGRGFRAFRERRGEETGWRRHARCRTRVYAKHEWGGRGE